MYLQDLTVIIVIRPLLDGGAGLTRGGNGADVGNRHVILIIRVHRVSADPVRSPVGSRIRSILDRLPGKPLHTGQDTQKQSRVEGKIRVKDDVGTRVDAGNSLVTYRWREVAPTVGFQAPLPIRSHPDGGNGLDATPDRVLRQLERAGPSRVEGATNVAYLVDPAL